MIQHDLDGLRWYTFNNIPDSKANYGIFTRMGGFSEGIHSSLNLGRTCGDDPEIVLANHQKVYKHLGRTLESRYNVWQVHGKTVHFPDAPLPAGKHPQAGDAMFTNDPKVTLAMIFADCYPILFYNHNASAVGIVHSGWQGTLIKICETAVHEACEHFACQPSDWHVGIGPGICGNCYEVGAEVREKYLAAWGADAEKYFKPHGQKYWLDLAAAIEDTLLAAGIQNLESPRICTAENLNEWYSYRKEKGATGRFGVVMALREA